MGIIWGCKVFRAKLLVVDHLMKENMQNQMESWLVGVCHASFGKSKRSFLYSPCPYIEAPQPQIVNVPIVVCSKMQATLNPEPSSLKPKP